MMLSAQAARMGSVSTTLRKIGGSHSFFTSVAGRRFVGLAGGRGGGGCCGSSLRASGAAAALSTMTGGTRFKSSTAATADYDETDDDKMLGSYHHHHRSRGHEEAAAAAREAAAATNNNNNKSVSSTSAHRDEAWMINLGRDSSGSDNWLVGDRARDWFTGLHPTETPGVDRHGHLRSLPLPNLTRVTRRSAKEYFDNSWTLYETLFAGLKGEEGFYRPPVHGLRHPQIFYYGHTACLYVNKLRLSGVLSRPVNAYYESIFEVGVDEMLWDDMHKNDMLWPTVREVHEYRKQVYEVVTAAIADHPSLDDDDDDGGEDGVRVDQSHPMWALFMGFEHERIHMETSSVLFRETPYHLVQCPAHWPPVHPSARAAADEHRNNKTSNPAAGEDYPANNSMIAVPAGTVRLGKPADFPSFGWDNEYGTRTVQVPAFAASEHMITNGEYWHFVAAGGYRNRQYWCDDGWAWRAHRNAKWPFFWEPAGPAGSNEYLLRTIFDIVHMPWDWPVDVNYYEAKAYCRWMTERDDDGSGGNQYRVLTEAEHHLLRDREHGLDAARNDVAADRVMVTSGEGFAAAGANLNLAFSSQNPVTYYAPSETGHRDVAGSAWEWTEDHFNPLDGFEIHPVYDDFSTPCFDGKHSMIVGGSFASTGDEASVFARFHFRSHFLQHSGFRLVTSDAAAPPATHLHCGDKFGGQAAARDAAAAAAAAAATASTDVATTHDRNEEDNVYETESLLNMYLGLHYPSSGQSEGVPPILPHDGCPNHGLRFPQRVAELLQSLVKPAAAATTTAALDVGCAVGGSSFELAKTFDRVDAFDYSHSFVDAAKKMQQASSGRGEEMMIRFRVPAEGDLYDEVLARHEDGVTEHVRSKVNFFQGDACHMQRMVERGLLLGRSSYDGALVSNLLCRLPDPAACLNALAVVLKPGGVAVLVTPYSWMEEYTARGRWLGGFSDPVSREPIRSEDALRGIMEKNGFDLIHEREMPLVIREHSRKYQYIVSQATGWRRMG